MLQSNRNSTQKCKKREKKTSPVKFILETLVLVRGITGLTVRVVDVLIVGLTRLAVLAT